MDQERASDDPLLNLPFSQQRREHRQQRIPFAERLSDKVRNHVVACIGEFIGTFFFLFLALSGAEVASGSVTRGELPDTLSRNLYISLSFGFSLTVNVWVMYRVSGGLFNPAVTIGLCLVDAVPWARGGFLIIAQLIAAIASSAVVRAILPGGLGLTVVNQDPQYGITIIQGFAIELLLTYIFVLSIMMMAAEKHAATHLAPVGIGLALFAAELSGVYYTGGSLNPARSFGPSVVTGTFYADHWIYWAGPIGGAILAAGTYKFLKVLEYERANPGQDDRGEGSGGLQI